MKELDLDMSFRPSAIAKGILDDWKKKRVFPRAVDGYAFAAAYAMREGASIDAVSMQSRSELVQVSILFPRVRRALEAGLHEARRRSNKPLPKTPTEVLDLVSRYAEVGVELLRSRWEGRSKSQIHDDVRRMLVERSSAGATGWGA